MASIPILAAVAAAIIVPVAGTGIYYSVKPSSQEKSIQKKPETTLEAPARKPHFSGSSSHRGAVSLPRREHGFTDVSGMTSNFISGTARLDSRKLGTAEESLRQLTERSDQETRKAIENLNRSLESGNIPELSGVRLPPSATLRVEETHSVSSHSSLTRT